MPAARKVLLIHPSALLYSEVYLRLEPIGMESVAAALESAGHQVRLVDLQVERAPAVFAVLESFRPEVVGFSVNYLANVPEVIDLAKRIKQLMPDTAVFVGGHSISFIAEEVLEHGENSIDAVVQGEGETTLPLIIAQWPAIDGMPGVVTAHAKGPKPAKLTDLNRFRPARHLLRHRRRYFIGELDPCASIEFSRGCPWDCSFCSAWTFYGRTYRTADPKRIADEIESIREPNLFIVDDVAFVHPEHGMAIAAELERRKIRKRFYLETRCDVLIRNEEVFARWAKLGLTYMFLGFESLNAQQLQLFRKRITPNQNFQALDVARKLGIDVAINLITDPNWEEKQFREARDWATDVPEIVHLTVATPYPGTELFHAQSHDWITTDYRLFDIQHAVTRTRMPLSEFYRSLVETQSLIHRKFMGWRTAVSVAQILAGHLLHGQTNFLRMLFKFEKFYNADRFFQDHSQPVRYSLRLPVPEQLGLTGRQLQIHRSTA